MVEPLDDNEYLDERNRLAKYLISQNSFLSALYPLLTEREKITYQALNKRLYS